MREGPHRFEGLEEGIRDERELDTAMAWTRVSVWLDEQIVAIDEVVERLRERGMRVDRVLRSVGIVTGSAQEVGALNAVPGVMSVDLDQAIEIGPPGEEIQ
ncbi:hypothetical protein [Naasia sp. SYSU D00948]|uniref:hypothetical protein n=1 Tax=Naasia sp. SYSU D00948 TaxID=2817379 RepID=UPI001B30327D|nr:hypothetical protein [Naasia sp. SYSU D00948]